ncbi:YceI family protein [Flavobacteriaceae bacterium S356]|uniref:YceI family protein n=1 Tax=Asprobacillus argus TaxID=3076534 RepID=A0ABU3LDI0_9FLAO|nr:YceI family protein [Flavobacteriaceae bacterium S356]
MKTITFIDRKKRLFIWATLCLFIVTVGHSQSKKIDMKDRFQINKDGSYVTFETSYFGFPLIRGAIKSYQATIFYDPEHIDKTSATIRFGAETVTTAHDKRDKQLHGTSFLDTGNFPGMWFQGTKVTTTDKGFDLTGKMSIKNINKEVTVHIEKPTVMRKAMGLRDLMMMKGWLKLNRKDFSLGTNSPMGQKLGDEIKIEFHFLCSNYTIDYLKASYVKEVSPGHGHPVGIVYTEIKTNGLKSGKKKLESLVKDPSYAKANWMSVLANLGWILMVDGYADEGLEFYKMALKRNPKHLPSLLRMGDAYVIGGYYDKALNHFKREHTLPERARFTHIPHMIKLLSGSFELNNMK